MVGVGSCAPAVADRPRMRMATSSRRGSTSTRTSSRTSMARAGLFVKRLRGESPGRGARVQGEHYGDHPTGMMFRARQGTTKPTGFRGTTCQRQHAALRFLCALRKLPECERGDLNPMSVPKNVGFSRARWSRRATDPHELCPADTIFLAGRAL